MIWLKCLIKHLFEVQSTVMIGVSEAFITILPPWFANTASGATQSGTTPNTMFTELSHSPHSPTDAASKPNRCCKQASLQNCMQAKEQPELRQLCSRLWHFLCCDIVRASCPKNLARSSSTSEILVSLMHCFKRSFISQFYHRKPRWFYEVGRSATGKHEHLWKLGG